MKITSQPLVFLDTTDSRKLEVYISSNHPTVQLYNVNNSSNKYTPDWSTTNLKLSADIFLDSEEITPQKKKWYRQSINEASETLISTGDYTDEITISANMTSAIVTYICRVEYQGLTAFAKITFTKTDTGLNGADGKDGTSVRILGTAVATPADDKDGYYTITYGEGAITAAAIGDGYIGDNGHLYVCTVLNDNGTGKDYFLDVGNIQGPPGTNGVDAKLITLSSSSQVFRVSNAGAVTPTTITVTAMAINTSVSAWTYSTDGGKTFSATAPTGLSRNGNTVTITGSTLSVNSVVIKASDGTYGDTLTVHKVSDGANGAKGDSAPVAFLTNENISFSANAGGEVAQTTFTTNVIAYNGTTKVTPVLGTITGMPTGMAVATPVLTANEQILTFTIADNSTLDSASSNSGTITIPVTSPVSANLKLSWSKINTGATGTPGSSGADAVTFQVYSNNGYTLSINTPAILLQTFAYVGDTPIRAGATYQWYSYATSGWTAISGATNSYYTVSRDSVSFSNSYMCKMQFNNAEYVGVATIDDKSDENKVFTTKPSSYTAGDLWIVGSDYAPPGFEAGTLLKAQYTKSSYADADWITATKYDKQLNDLQNNIAQYNQHFSFNSTDGVKITAKDNNGVESKYSTTISNDRWAINYGSEAVTYVDETKMHIKEAEIESPLSVTGKYSGSTMLQAPTINLGNFSFVIESNGSLSVVVKS